MSYCKYTKQRRQQSPDGVNWFDMNEYQKGSLIQCGLISCNEHGQEEDIPSIYSWNNIGTTVCDGYDLYHELVYQVSYDNGHTWQDVEPRQTMRGSLIESNSLLCGYKPDSPVDYNSAILSGKWLDSSSDSNWRFNESITALTTSLKDYTNPDTKEFSIEVKDTKSFQRYFEANNALEKIYTVPFFGRGITSMYKMFESCEYLNEIKNLQYWDTSSLKTMDRMFYACNSFTNYEDISNWDVSNVTSMVELFRYNKGVTTLDLSKWKLYEDGVTVTSIFANSSLKTLDISTWNPSLLKYPTQMFYNCNSLRTIRCTQEFKDWCSSRLNSINLNYGNITWEIV